MRNEPRWSWVKLAVGAVLVIPLVYVASFGPAFALAATSEVLFMPVVHVYTPLFVPEMPPKFRDLMVKYGEACSDQTTLLKIRFASRILQNNDLESGRTGYFECL